MSSQRGPRPRRGSGPVWVTLGGITLGGVLLSGCFGDPPPDPATAPLEVVLDGCLLNRDEVAAGPHDVSVVGDGELVVEDESGAEVLTGGGTLVTSEGTYTFICTVGADEWSVVLRSVAAED